MLFPDRTLSAYVLDQMHTTSNDHDSSFHQSYHFMGSASYSICCLNLLQSVLFTGNLLPVWFEPKYQGTEVPGTRNQRTGPAWYQLLGILCMSVYTYMASSFSCGSLNSEVDSASRDGWMRLALLQGWFPPSCAYHALVELIHGLAAWLYASPGYPEQGWKLMHIANYTEAVPYDQKLNDAFHLGKRRWNKLRELLHTVAANSSHFNVSYLNDQPRWLRHRISINPFSELVLHKIVIFIDGGGPFSGVLKPALLSESTVAKVNYKWGWGEWFESMMVPHVHYEPVATNLVDLSDKVSSYRTQPSPWRWLPILLI